MIATSVVSPYLAPSAPLPASAGQLAAEQPPVDVVTTSAAESSAHLSFGQKAGVALMAGVTILGAGVLTPGTAHAHPPQHGYSHSQVVPARHNGGGYGHRNSNRALGEAIVGGIIGGIIGGAIANGGYYPVYPVVPVPIPVPGYNAMGCDGVYHHFDPYGNVADGSGHYRLIQDQWGNCYRTAPSPY